MKRLSYGRLDRLRRVVPAWKHTASGWLPDSMVSKVDQTGILFIHIPKTGGTSVSAFLYCAEMPHRRARELRFYHPLRYRKSFTFAVVRDPIDRFLSSYDYLSLGGTTPHDAAFAEEYVQPFGDVNLFASQLGHAAFARKVTAFLHFSTQASYVCSGGRCIVDRLARFDRLEADCADILGRPAALPRLNVTPGRRTRRDALHRRSLDIVRNIYTCDFRLEALASADGTSLFGRRC